MHYSVEWLSRSLQDLDNIYDSLSSYSEKASIRLIEKILNRVEQLHNNPRSGQLEDNLVDEPEEFRYLVWSLIRLFMLYMKIALAYLLFLIRDRIRVK